MVSVSNAIAIDIMYMLSFLLQADLLSHCLFEGLCYKTLFAHTRFP